VPERVKLLLVCLLLLAVNVSNQQAQSSRAAQRHPNVVFMFADNFGWGEVGMYGSVRGDFLPTIAAAAGAEVPNKVRQV
jgi:hypothetical protein